MRRLTENSIQDKETLTTTLSDGRKIGYAEYGDSKGYPLFHFHGWPSSRLAGAEIDLAAKHLGIRVISTDRPGIGISEPKSGRTLLDFASDVDEIANNLKLGNFSLIGMSGGAPYVAACAYMLGKRVDSATIVVGLAPIDLPGIIDEMTFINRLGWRFYNRVPALRWLSALFLFLGFKIVPKLGRFFIFSKGPDKDIYRNLLKNRNTMRTEEAFKQGVPWVADELRVYTESWGFNLSMIGCKTFLWYGRKDRSVTVQMGEYYRSVIPNSELIIKEEWGHLSRYEHEEEILKKIKDILSEITTEK